MVERKHFNDDDDDNNENCDWSNNAKHFNRALKTWLGAINMHFEPFSRGNIEQFASLVPEKLKRAHFSEGQKRKKKTKSVGKKELARQKRGAKTSFSSTNLTKPYNHEIES